MPAVRGIRTCASACLVTLISTAGVSSTLGAQIQSSFDASDEGWRVVEVASETDYGTVVWGPVAPTWNESGGTPGGNISFADVYGVEFYFDAPQPFLGNQLDKYNGELYWALRNDPSGALDAADVVLIGAGLVLVNYDPPQATDQWGTYWVILRETAGWHVGSRSGRQPTRQEFQSVLASLVALRIRGEFVSGNETGFLDSVSFEPFVPSCPDLNGDGQVDLADLSIVLASFGESCD